MSLLRLQQPCPRRDRRSALARGAAARARPLCCRDARAAPRLGLLRRRHAVADGAGDRGGAARPRGLALADRQRCRDHARGQSRLRSRRRGSRTSAPPASIASPWAFRRSTTAPCASSAAATSAAEARAALALARRNLPALLLRSHLRAAGAGGRRMGGRARRRPGLGRRSSLALSAHHRARHRLRHGARARRFRAARRGPRRRAL